MGDSFLARMGQLWEAAAQKAEPLGVRVARIRTAMVFGKGAPALGLITLADSTFSLARSRPSDEIRQTFSYCSVPLRPRMLQPLPKPFTSVDE